MACTIGRYVSPSNMMFCDKWDNKKEGFSLCKSLFERKRDTRDSVITNVATQPPIIVPSREREVVAKPNHVAWTSVRQERWEGELVVEGEIPLWLVRKLQIMCILHLRSHLYMR